MILENPIIRIAVPDRSRFKFKCTRFNESWLVELSCNWKDGLAKPFAILFLWDRLGRSLAFQHEAKRDLLKNRIEYERNTDCSSDKLMNIRIKTTGELSDWWGQQCETSGRGGYSTQSELLCESRADLIAFTQFSTMQNAKQSTSVMKQCCHLSESVRLANGSNQLLLKGFRHNSDKYCRDEWLKRT